MMNKYQELIQLIEKNELVIEKIECNTGIEWSGCRYIICDEGTVIFDLSINGCCFVDSSVDEAIKAIKKHFDLKNMDSFEAFRTWVDDKAIDSGRKY